MRRSMPPRKPSADMAKPKANSFLEFSEKVPAATLMEIIAIESTAVSIDQPNEIRTGIKTLRNEELEKSFSASVTTRRIDPELRVVRCFK
jgi:hypothetical protein